MKTKESYSVRQEIKKAVIKLMTEKTYLDITVTDIINKAQVARASFYRNFSSISDVLDEITDEIVNELFEDVVPILFSNDERKWRDLLFLHFYRFQRFMKKQKNIRIDNLSVFFNRMDEKMRQKKAELPSGTIRDKYMPSGKIGLINSITIRWMDEGMKESPEEMIDYIMSVITLF